MNANELRIGNIIGMDLKEFPQNYFKVFEVAEKSMKVSDSWLSDDGDFDYYDADLMEGIPLTEEWLLKFGFEKVGYEWSRPKESHTFSGNLYAPKFELCWYEHAPCNTVHQFQNLYFAICGEELTIK